MVSAAYVQAFLLLLLELGLLVDELEELRVRVEQLGDQLVTFFRARNGLLVHCHEVRDQLNRD